MNPIWIATKAQRAKCKEKQRRFIFLSYIPMQSYIHAIKSLPTKILSKLNCIKQIGFL
jgi:hypothetical protein